MKTKVPFRDVTPEERESYDQRFETFLFKLDAVANYRPREKYLYPVMDGVPFNDFEVALDIAALFYTKANDEGEIDLDV